MQRTLGQPGAGVAGRLLPVAMDWQKLLEAEQAVLDLEAEEAESQHGGSTGPEIPNPFVFGNPVLEQDTNVFTGRQDIVRQIEETVLGTEQAPILLLHGPRRMGKTSILNQLPRLLGPYFAPAVVDCQNPAVTGSAATLLSYLSRALCAGLQRRHVNIHPLQREWLDHEPFTVFDEWLDDLESIMPRGMRALLCLDEYENLASWRDAAQNNALLDAMRHVLQFRPRVVLLFSGVRTFEEQGPGWTSRFLSVRRIRVSFLRREEVLPLLTRPIPHFGMSYAEGGLESIFRATSGQPFLIQALAFELVQLLNEEQRKQASAADVDRAIPRALVSSSEYFANLWFDTGAEGQTILRALARAEPAPDFPKARAWLRAQDVLTEAGTFAVPMVEQWVKKEKIDTG